MTDKKIPHPLGQLRRDLRERADWLRDTVGKARSAAKPVVLLPSDLERLALLIEIALVVIPDPTVTERDDD